MFSDSGYHRETRAGRSRCSTSVPGLCHTGDQHQRHSEPQGWRLTRPLPAATARHAAPVKCKAELTDQGPGCRQGGLGEGARRQVGGARGLSQHPVSGFRKGLFISKRDPSSWRAPQTVKAGSSSTEAEDSPATKELTLAAGFPGRARGSPAVPAGLPPSWGLAELFIQMSQLPVKPERQKGT